MGDFGKNQNADQIERVLCYLCVFDEQHRLLIQRRRPQEGEEESLWDLTISDSMQNARRGFARVQRLARELLGLRELTCVKFDRQIRSVRGLESFYVSRCDTQTEQISAAGAWADRELCFAEQATVVSLLQAGAFRAYGLDQIHHLFQLEKSL